MGKDYVPTADTAKLTWADNLKNKLPSYGTTLGLTATEITNYQTLCDGIKDAITSKAAAQANAKKVNQESDFAIDNNVTIAQRYTGLETKARLYRCYWCRPAGAKQWCCF